MYFQEQEILPKKKKDNKFLIISLVIISIAAGVLITNLLEIDLANLINGTAQNSNNPETNGLSTSTQSEKDAEANRILNEVKEIVLVNPNEVPTIANIKSIAALQAKNPLFYKDAMDGDFLIIYTDRAIIYRESDNKIIAMIPFEPDAQAAN